MYNGFWIKENKGNNAFNYDKRLELLGKAQIYIPALIESTIDDLRLGEFTAFEEINHIGNIISCNGLERFIKIKNKEIYIFDNHNHALYFWYKRFIEGKIQKGNQLIHIDQHSDLNNCSSEIDLTKENNLSYIFEYVNLQTNVGNYINPAIKSGLINEKNIVLTNYGLTKLSENFKNYDTNKTILNIDMDFFYLKDPDFDNKFQLIKSLIKHFKFITIATSPFFIDQKYVIGILKEISK